MHRNSMWLAPLSDYNMRLFSTPSHSFLSHLTSSCWSHGIWPFRSSALSFPGAKSPRTFVPWNFRNRRLLHTQTRASRVRESSVTHKSAITGHAVEENHVVNWHKAKVVDREAQRQTRWLKEALWIRRTPKCMNRNAISYQLSHTWDQVISRSRAPSSCKQSRRDQDVRRMLLGNTFSVV